MIDDFVDMIAGSLNLKEPRYVMDAEFCAERQEVHIFVGVREEAVFTCPHCGVKQISAPFERRNSRFTLLFEGYAMLMLAR